MAVKKIKPKSPDPYLGKTTGDATLARIAHVNQLADQINGELNKNHCVSVNLDDGDYYITVPGVYEINSTAYHNRIYLPSSADLKSYGSKYTIVNSSEYPAGIYNLDNQLIIPLDALSAIEIINVNGTWRGFYYLTYLIGNEGVFDVYCYNYDCMHSVVVKDITSTTATFCANVKGKIGVSLGVLAIGFVYNTNVDPTIDDMMVGTDIAAFGKREILVEYLQPDTIYHVRAFYSNNVDPIAYSEDVMFRTLP